MKKSRKMLIFEGEPKDVAAKVVDSLISRKDLGESTVGDISI